MTTSPYRFASFAGVLALSLTMAVQVQAQGLDMLKELVGGGSSTAPRTMSLGTVGNAAGVIEYCLTNNYLRGDAASSVKDKLMSKITGSNPTSDSGYVDGSKGILTNSDGKKMDLTGSGFKQKITAKACDFVLKQGKSMI